ncbi:MAG: hypothetical protein KF760_08375 [Candidatus Eremiobacteraeota bacterium]|nr:hypothetical protein [Candidatus Eremiobacteraeota bacterium]MCW5870888.1 hypothetical protein [Candidatus Eremiobacteraeota bacterium]
MRTLLLCGLLLTSAVSAQEAGELVPSYSFQGPKRHVQRYSAPSTHKPPAYSQPRTIYQPPQPSLSFMGAGLGQRPVPPSLSNWGGTVVQADTAGYATITSNGSIPTGSLVGIGRGTQFLGQARVTVASTGGAQLATTGNLQLAPGDWVNVISIPAPPPQQRVAYAGASSARYHPTSTNADPTYQRWLRQGFTLGSFHRGRIYSSYGGFRRSYR